MPYCPNCKTEYIKDIEVCSDCGSKLVEQLDKVPETEYDKEAFLINVADEIQAEIIISKLSTFNIPVLKKHKESGSFMAVYMGNTLFGIDLYVPEKLLVTAKELINENVELIDENLEFDEMMNDFGFEDIDNMEFEENAENNLDNSFKEEVFAETTKNNNVSTESNVIDFNIHRDNSQNEIPDEQLSYRNKARKMITTVILLIFIPIIIVTIYSIYQLLR